MLSFLILSIQIYQIYEKTKNKLKKIGDMGIVNFKKKLIYLGNKKLKIIL